VKIFARKVCIFLIPILLAVVGFEIYLRNISTVYTKKLSGLLSNADSIEVLIVGNSHACYGLLPAEFSMRAFNSAQTHQSIYFDKRITLKYIDQLVNLKYVLISVDFHSLYFSSQGIRNVWSYYAYNIEYKNRLPLISKISYLNGYTAKASISFLRKHLFTNKPFNVPIELESNSEYIGDGNFNQIVFRGTDGDAFNPSAYLHRSLAFNNTVNQSRENEEIIFDLIDFILKLKSKGVTPILITLPVYNEFLPYLDTEISAKNKVEIERIRDLYNLEYFNFTDTILPKNYFYNCDHLNANGARHISRIVNAKLDSIEAATKK
jgi:hypothetical protein